MQAIKQLTRIIKLEHIGGCDCINGEACRWIPQFLQREITSGAIARSRQGRALIFDGRQSGGFEAAITGNMKARPLQAPRFGIVSAPCGLVTALAVLVVSVIVKYASPRWFAWE